MSQTATLYSMTQTTFNRIKKRPAGIDIPAITESSLPLGNSFEGLLYVLSNGQQAETKLLLKQLFYPQQHLGEEMDWDNYENIDWDNPAIYYNTPEEVAEICAFLDTISPDQFSTSFEPDELNRNSIYPAGAWNSTTDPYREYNILHLLKQFSELKTFMYAAKGNYVFCYLT